MEIKTHMHHAYARRLAGRVARYLKDRYGAKKVMLLGSLVTGFFNPDFSDIGVGFEGIRKDLEEDALADCRFHFGYRDSDGIQRLHVVNLASLGDANQRLLRGEAEEI